MHQAIVYEALHLFPGHLQLLVFGFEGLSYPHADAFILELGRWLLECDLHGPGRWIGYVPFITIQADRWIDPSRLDRSMIMEELMAWSARGEPSAQLLPHHRAWLCPFIHRVCILVLLKDRFWHHVLNVGGSFVQSDPLRHLRCSPLRH